MVEQAQAKWRGDQHPLEHLLLIQLGGQIRVAQKDWRGAVSWLEETSKPLLNWWGRSDLDFALPAALQPGQAAKELGLSLLAQCREIYFDHLQDYRTAFTYSQTITRTKKQMGDYAFIGAGRMEAVAGQGGIAAELAAAGRDEVVLALKERLLRNDYKLVVLYGQSGVGKSSLLQAGLVPTVKAQMLGQGRLWPVYVRRYDEGLQELAAGLELTAGADWAAITAQVQAFDRQDRRVILIFDQFEEFFFAFSQRAEQQRFFDGLAGLLRILSVKVVLSLRKDYLHLLVDYSAIAPNQAGVLAADNLYELRDFTPAEATQLIERLTGQSNFRMSGELTRRVVADLTREETVRPIELQILGSELQEQGIRELAQYEGAGGKERLLQDYVTQVTRACGPANAPLAGATLFLLTDEQQRRLLKTRSELDEGLQQLRQSFTAEQLDLVLDILGRSGLVVEIPEEPEVRYQILHDYLVGLIRALQEPLLAQLAAELEQEKTQRIEAEGQLAQVQEKIEAAEKQRVKLDDGIAAAQQRLRRLGTITAGGIGILAVIAGIVSWRFTQRLERVTQAQGVAEKTALTAKDQTFNAYMKIAEAQRDERALKAQQEIALRQVKNLDEAVSKAKNLEQTARKREQSANRQYQEAVQQVDLAEQKLQTVNRDKTASEVARQQAIQARDQAQQAVIEAAEELKVAQSAVSKVQAKQQALESQAVALRQEQETLQARNREAQANLVASQIQALTTKAEALHLKNPHSLDALLVSLESGDLALKAMQKTSSPVILAQQLPTALKLNQLQQDVRQRDERNAQSPVTSVAVVAGGKYFVSGSEDGKVRVWDLESNSDQPLHSFDAQSQVLSVVVVEDGKRIVSGSSDGKVQVWDLESKGDQPLYSFDAQSQVLSVTVVGDGKRIVSGSEDGKVRVWDLDKNDDQKPRIFDVQSEVFSVAAIGDEYIVSGSLDGKVQVWDLNKNDNQKPRIFFFNVENPIWSVAAVGDKYIVSGGYDGQLQVWDLAKSEDQKPLIFDIQSQVRFVAALGNNKLLVSGSDDGKVRVWNLESNSDQPLHSFDAQSPVTSVAVGAGGKHLVSGSDDGKVRVWDLASNSNTILRAYDAKSPALSVAVVAGGKRLVSGSDDGKVRVWDLASNGNTLLRTYDAGESSVKSVTVAKVSASLVSGSEDGKIRIWNLDKNEDQQPRIFDAGESGVMSVTVVGSKYLVSGSLDGNTLVWDLDKNDNQKPYIFDANEHGVTLVVAIEDRNLVSGSGDGKIRMWDLDKNEDQKPRIFDAGESGVMSATVVGSKYLVSGSLDGKALVWDLDKNDNQKPRTFYTQSAIWSVGGVDGKYFVTGEDDGKVLVWDLESNSNQPLHSFDVQSSINAVATESQSIISASADGKVRVWDLDLERLMGSGCRWAQQYIESHPDEKKLQDICQPYY